MSAALKLDMSARAFAAALLATAVVVAGAGWFVAIAPKHHKAANLETQIQAAQQQLSAARLAVAKAKSAERPVLQAALPSELQMPQILDQLNAMANRAEVTLDSVTPSAAVVGTGYYEVPLTVTVEGRYFEVKTFLQLVRNRVTVKDSQLYASGRLFDVSSVQLSETPPTVTGTLQMTAYYFAAAATVPAPVDDHDRHDEHVPDGSRRSEATDRGRLPKARRRGRGERSSRSEPGSCSWSPARVRRAEDAEGSARGGLSVRAGPRG